MFPQPETGELAAETVPAVEVATDGALADVLGCCEGASWRYSVTGRRWSCPGCRRILVERLGINVLASEADPEPRFEDIDADAGGSIDLEQSGRLRDIWLKMITGHTRREPRRVLQIGAGTGAVTLSLTLGESVGDLFATDVSASLLRVAKSKVDAHGLDKTRTHYVAADFTDLPFRPGAFDAIIGNSVLHRVLDYGGMLGRCRNLLAEGGVALFNEPVLQGKLVVALLLRIIIDADEISGSRFSEEERKRLCSLVWLCTIEKVLRANEAARETLTEKHIFDLEQLGAEAGKLGFSRFCSENTGSPRGSARSHSDFLLGVMGLDPKILDPYQFVFDAYEGVVLDLIGAQASTPHRYLIFEN